MVSVSAPSGLAAPDKRMCRIISAPGEPPGSRVSTTASPSAVSFSASLLACVDLPLPSPPSKVMKRPRIALPRHDPFGAGTEQADHRFGHGIEGAAGETASLDIGGGVHGRFQHDVFAAPHFERADRGAL